MKPRTHVGGAHLSGDQREGQTPTPPTTRGDTPSSDQKVEKAPVNQEQVTKETPTAVDNEVTAVTADKQQQPEGDTKVSDYTMPGLCHLTC